MVALPFWWNVLALVVTLVFGYVAAANIANWLGDAIGYRWGQRVLEKRWQAFVRERERDQTSSPLLISRPVAAVGLLAVWVSHRSALDTPAGA